MIGAVIGLAVVFVLAAVFAAGWLACSLTAGRDDAGESGGGVGELAAAAFDAIVGG